MEINYTSGKIEFNYKLNDWRYEKIVIKSEEILDVKKFDFSFMTCTLSVVCLKSIKCLFFYDNERTYVELIRMLYENPKEVKKLLVKYYTQTGMMKDFIVCIYTAMCNKYNIRIYQYFDNVASYSEKPNISNLDDAFGPRNHSYPLFKAERQDLYQAFVAMRPENIEKKRLEIKARERLLAEEKERKRKVEAENLIVEIPENYDAPTNYTMFINSLDMGEHIDLKKCRTAMEAIELKKKRVQELTVAEFLDAECGKKLYSILEGAYKTLSKICIEEGTRLRERELGPVSLLKKNLRESLNELGFVDLLDLYREYKSQEEVLRKKKNNSHPGVKDSYNPYIKIYQYGAILISNRMNQLM